MRKFPPKIIIAALILFFIVISYPIARILRSDIKTSKEIAENTWSGYKYYFIDRGGRVRRPKEKDTVSEGQAYAMLRAVWMDDKETFDRCYRWTENNLSRQNETGDNLLAWHWKGGKVLDWMPASDADVDYALSLIFADSRWKNSAPPGVEDYGEKAKRILNDILRLETYTTANGRLYLSPWILDNKEHIEIFPVNPSYYSPAHFQIFYRFSRDKQWLELVDTTYYILGSLSRRFDGKSGVGLIPDWCSVDNNDRFYRLEGKNTGFGWEAVRIPFRLAMDYFWFDSQEAKDFFKLGLSDFVEREWRENGVIFCEYDYSGKSTNKYESPLFYASYASALLVSEGEHSKELLAKSREYIRRYDDYWIYQDNQEYYVNSLAWFSDGFISKKIKNFK